MHIGPLQLRHSLLALHSNGCYQERARQRALIRYSYLVVESYVAMARRVAGSGFLPGYTSSIADARDKQQYAEKIVIIGCDPYEISKAEWDDNCGHPLLMFTSACV